MSFKVFLALAGLLNLAAAVEPGLRSYVIWAYDESFTGAEVFAQEVSLKVFEKLSINKEFISKPKPLQSSYDFLKLLDGRCDIQFKCEKKECAKTVEKTCPAKEVCPICEKTTCEKPTPPTPPPKTTTPPPKPTPTTPPPRTTPTLKTKLCANGAPDSSFPDCCQNGGSGKDCCTNGGSGPYCCTNGVTNNPDCCVKGSGKDCCENGGTGKNCCTNGGSGPYCCTNGVTNNEDCCKNGGSGPNCCTKDSKDPNCNKKTTPTIKTTTTTSKPPPRTTPSTTTKTTTTKTTTPSRPPPKTTPTTTTTTTTKRTTTRGPPYLPVSTPIPTTREPWTGTYGTREYGTFRQTHTWEPYTHTGTWISRATKSRRPITTTPRYVQKVPTKGINLPS